MGRYQTALEDFNIILKQKPDFYQALLQRAKVYLRDCDLEKAKADLNQLIQAGNELDEAKKLLDEVNSVDQAASEASKLLKKNSYDEGIEKLSHVLNSCQNSIEYRVQRAEAYEKKGDFAQAIGDFSRISVLKADNLPTLLRISNLHLQLGEVDSAISSLRSCLQSDPEHKECSKLFRRLKKLSKSIARAQESMEKNRHRDALGPDALNADQTGKDGAMVFMNELNITGAAKKKVLNMICECYAKLKSHDRAVRWCSDAIETDPETTINYCYRGDSYLGKEEFEAALRDYNSASKGGQPPQCAQEGMRKAQKLQRQASRKDYYKILEVPRDADERQIKKAYRRKAMEFHPDRYKGDKEYAEKKMAEINQAYEVLGNAELRQRFDHGDDPNDPTGGHGGHGHPFGSHVVFQQGGPFGFGGGSDQFFQFHFG